MSSLPIADISNESPLGTATAARSAASVLICLPSLSPEALQTMHERIAAALPGQSVLLASPDVLPENTPASETIQLVEYPAAPPHAGWALTSSDYLGAADLAQKHGAST